MAMLALAAHLALFGSSLSSLTSLWALRPSPPALTAALPYTTFSGLLLYGIAGLLRYAFPNVKSSAYVNKFLNITRVFTRSLALPCVVTYLYLISGYSPQIAYIHLISGSVPVVLFLLKLGASTKLVDVVLAANIISLLYVSYSFGNMWGIGLGVCHILNHFCLNQFEDVLTAPVDCLFVVGMCFFNAFAIKTVKNY